MRYLLIAALLLSACAHGQYKKYDPITGHKILDIGSWVFGTGEMEQLIDGYGYSTRDTGLSDNGRDLGGEIAEGAVRGMMGGLPL